MVQLQTHNPSSVPYCDNSRVLFEISDGRDLVACAISRMALEDMSGGRCFKPSDMLKSFARVRSRVEVLALQKLRMRPEGVTGRLSLWSDDVNEQPDDHVPEAASLGSSPS